MKEKYKKTINGFIESAEHELELMAQTIVDDHGVRRVRNFTGYIDTMLEHATGIGVFNKKYSDIFAMAMENDPMGDKMVYLDAVQDGLDIAREYLAA